MPNKPIQYGYTCRFGHGYTVEIQSCTQEGTDRAANMLQSHAELVQALQFATDKLCDAISLGGCTAGSYKRARDEARAILAKVQP